MQSLKLLLITWVLLALVSCTTSPRKDYRPPAGGEYVTASWYGAKFHGRPTSSGERYDMHGYTAAHKKLKFGTRLRVTNPDTDRSVVVLVNDRGPFIRGRDLDLSYGAAKAIGFAGKGVGKVRIEYLGRDMRYKKRVPFMPSDRPEHLTIQVGSFSDESNARRFKAGLALEYSNVYISAADVKGKRFYRVRIGKFKSRESAIAVAERLADEGYNLFITNKN